MQRWFLFAALAGCDRPAAAEDCAIALAPPGGSAAAAGDRISDRSGR